MSTQTSHVSTYGRYIGRVGALAAALGIGVMVATSPGVASADSSSSSSTSSDASSADTGSAAEGAQTDTSTVGATSTDSGPSATDIGSSAEVSSGVTVSSSGGAHTSTTDSETVTDPLEEDDTSGVETQPESSESADPEEAEESAEAGAPPVAPDPEAEEPTSTPVEAESNSADSTTVNAVTTPSPATSVGAVEVVSAATQPSATVTESSPVPPSQALEATTASSSSTNETVAVAAASVVPTGQVANPVIGVVGFLNSVVTNLLTPFLAPAPNTPEPVTPVAWAVLAWVRRNLFNQSPDITYNPTTTVQSGQTVTGKIGATDPEGDALTYKVTKAPQHGTLTIDQATGTFTYTPNDINYTAAQTDSFSVSVSDGKFNVLGLFGPRGDQERIGVTVLNPTVERVILNLPDNLTNPTNSRYAADGKSILFAAQPTAGGRSEIYQIGVDGTDLRCITCGVSPEVTVELRKMTPFEDGSGRILVEAGNNKWVVFEDGANGKQLVSIATPPAGARVLEPTREMRISPDGTHVVFTQIQLGQGGVIAAVPVVGTLTRTANGYEIVDARVIFPTGEAKQWTHDGKGVIILAGTYEAGNVDDIVVDMATGEVTRLTGNLDYDEDTDLSPNEKWIAIGSTRGLDALTPMSRIVRPAFLPAHIQGSVYERYANPINVSNQEWLIAVEDDLKREQGIPLFVTGDGYTARSMPGWSPTGDAVTFWERSITDPTDTRLVIANLKYTTSVGAVEGDQSTPHPNWAPQLSTYVPSAPPLPPTGTYAGVGGGTAVVSERPDPTNPAATIRTVSYTNYVNDQGMVLNGTESTSTTTSQNSVRYIADITVSGAHTGYLRGDVTINKLTRSITPTTPGSMITSDVDGDVMVLLDPARIAEAQQSA